MNEPIGYVEAEDVSGVSRRELFRRSGLAVIVAAPAVGALLPEPARAQLFGRPSADQQKKLGQQAAQEILRKYREVTDRRAAHFREIGARLVASLPASEQRKWDYTFRVLESDELNAFALPGGPMFLYTGLYKLMKSDDEIAGVTGHELGHVRGEHWSKAAGKEQERNVAIGLGLSILKGGKAAQAAAGLLSNLEGLRYGRSEENDSDEKGLANMVAAGYNPQGMIDLFRTLERASGGSKGGLLGDRLASHPMTSTRIKNTQERIAALSRRGIRFPAMKPLSYQSLVS